MLTFYIAAAQPLQKKPSLGFQNLKDLVALHPQSRQAKFTLKAITRLARQFPHVIKKMKLLVSVMSGKLSKVNQYHQIGMKQLNFASCIYVFFFFLTLII